MRLALCLITYFAFIATAFAQPAASPAFPSPSTFLKMNIGADRVVADYRQIHAYFRALADASPRVDLVSLGKTTLGEEMVMAVISSDENLKNIARIKEISRKLADPRGLSAAEITALSAEGKVVVLVTCNIHSTEIASSQMAMEWAHALATAEDEATRKRLSDTVLLLVPSLNPDGQIMETEWYRKYLGTPYEGGSMPRLYHHYVGHDNNRDWFMLTQKETRNMSRAIYHEWFPQIFVDEHQMGSRGPRIFVPPFADPLDPDVHPLIMREIALIGTNMAFRLEQNEKAGVISRFQFDAYLLGTTRNTGWWKNVTGLLTETASARFASPIYIDPSELRGGEKGLTEYQAQTSFPNPWRGGWWRLRDIMDYGRIVSDAILEVASERRVDLLRNMARRASDVVAESKPNEGYLMRRDQRDYPTARRLAQIMADHNVEVLESENGDYWIPLAQPYGRFVREMMEPQRYPETKAVPGGEILEPYDVVSWSLPLSMGVLAERTMREEAVRGRRVAAAYSDAAPVPVPLAAGDYFSISRSSAEAAKVANAALAAGAEVMSDDRKFYFSRAAATAAATRIARTGVQLEPSEKVGATKRIRLPRVGLYKPWAASMDEGWTRWILEQYGFAPLTIENTAMRAGALRERFDVVILPDSNKDVLATGRPKPREGEMKYFVDMPPEFRGGLAKEGADALRAFVQSGGTLIAFESASEYVIEEFNIPVRNALAGVTRASFGVPGSLLRINVRQGHPITAGMPSETAAFVSDAIAFDTTLPGPDTERWILATYPEDERDVLLSGWIKGADHLTRRAAAVAVSYGKGKIVLFGFRPQHRAQTHATFPMLFNALYWE